MKYFSMFSGIGGFELGIQQAYENRIYKERQMSKRQDLQPKGDCSNNTQQGRENGTEQPTCIGYSEIDKYAIQIYEQHFKHKNYGDATKIDTGQLPDFDLLVGGFPCQAFSIAGRRKGFDDTRGTLFFEIARILRDKRPRYFLLENVKGLLSHEQGKTFQTILGVLTDLGYGIEWQVLNSKNFGVPQNRERVFIIGHIRGTSRPKVFPIGESNQMDNDKSNGLQNPQTAVALRATDYKGTHNLVQLKGGSQGNRVYDPKGISTTIAGQAGGQGAKTGLYAIGGLQKHQTIRKDGISPCLPEAMGKGGGHTPMIIPKDMKIRRLTPTECERLQGFPDGWTEGVSDTQRYKCLGNAVTVNVVREIINQLINK